MFCLDLLSAPPLQYDTYASESHPLLNQFGVLSLFFAESREKQTQRIMRLCADPHAEMQWCPRKWKTQSHGICLRQNAKQTKHVMLHDWPMPRHHATLRKIELFFFFYSSLYITICQRILHPECRHCPSSGDTELRNLVVSRGSRTPQAARKWISSNCGWVESSHASITCWILVDTAIFHWLSIITVLLTGMWSESDEELEELELLSSESELAISRWFSSALKIPVTMGSLRVCPNCKKVHVKDGRSLRNFSNETSGSWSGAWEPRCSGVTKRNPPRTWAITVCCSANWPEVSSREYNRMLPRLWWPWRCLCSSVTNPRWASWFDQLSVVVLSECNVAALGSDNSTPSRDFHGNVQ